MKFENHLICKNQLMYSARKLVGHVWLRLFLSNCIFCQCFQPSSYINVGWTYLKFKDKIVILNAGTKSEILRLHLQCNLFLWSSYFCFVFWIDIKLNHQGNFSYQFCTEDFLGASTALRNWLEQRSYPRKSPKEK